MPAWDRCLRRRGPCEAYAPARSTVGACARAIRACLEPRLPIQTSLGRASCFPPLQAPCPATALPPPLPPGRKVAVTGRNQRPSHCKLPTRPNAAVLSRQERQLGPRGAARRPARPPQLGYRPPLLPWAKAGAARCRRRKKHPRRNDAAFSCVQCQRRLRGRVQRLARPAQLAAGRPLCHRERLL